MLTTRVFNGDGVVNGADLTFVLAGWDEPGPLGDLDLDGIVSAADLALRLGAWTQ